MLQRAEFAIRDPQRRERSYTTGIRRRAERQLETCILYISWNFLKFIKHAYKTLNTFLHKLFFQLICASYLECFLSLRSLSVFRHVHSLHSVLPRILGNRFFPPFRYFLSFCSLRFLFISRNRCSSANSRRSSISAVRLDWVSSSQISAPVASMSSES